MITKQILENSFRFSGLSEIRGSENNNTIIHWIRTHFPFINNEEDIAWCAIFVTEMFRLNGYEHLIPDKPFGAISWRSAGIRINNVEDLKVGDLVITARYSFSDWRSHIGWFLGVSEFDKSSMVLFGGNQNNKVGSKNYPIAKFRYGVRIQ